MVVGMTRVGATGGASMTRVTAICFTFCTENSSHPAPFLLFQSFLYQSDKAIRAYNFNARSEGQHTDNNLRFIGCVIFQMKQILIIVNTLCLLFKVCKVSITRSSAFRSSFICRVSSLICIVSGFSFHRPVPVYS